MRNLVVGGAAGLDLVDAAHLLFRVRHRQRRLRRLRVPRHPVPVVGWRRRRAHRERCGGGLCRADRRCILGAAEQKSVLHMSRSSAAQASTVGADHRSVPDESVANAEHSRLV
eukprot:3217338-Rhodomonas_salina.2